MNRIYQGRVNQVEIPDPKSKGKWLLFHRDKERAREFTKIIPELRQRVDAEIVIRTALSDEERANRPKSPELLKYESLRAEQRQQWQEALWGHHQLFQDGVNYYTVILATMAQGALDEEGKATAMADFAAQVKERWGNFTHKGKTRLGLRSSICRTLRLPDNETSTFEVCVARILEGALKHFPGRKDVYGRDVFHGVIAEMFPEKSRGLSPQKMANTDWPWLCWAKASGETPAKAYYRKNHGIHDFMADLFEGNRQKLAMLAKKTVAETCLTSVAQAHDDEEGNADVNESENAENEETEEQDDGVERFVGTAAIDKLKLCVATAKRLLEDVVFRTDFELMGGNPAEAESELVRIGQAVTNKQKDCEKEPEAFSFQKWKTGGENKDNDRVDLFVLFAFDAGSNFCATLLKARLKKLYLPHLLKTDPAKFVGIVNKYGLCGPADRENERIGGKEPFKIVAEAIKKAEKSGAGGLVEKGVGALGYRDCIGRIRENNKIVFPGFTAIRGFVTPAEDLPGSDGVKGHAWKIGTTEWKNFEFAAFEEALKSPNQIKKKKEERDKEWKKLKAVEKLYLGRGREKALDEDGEEEAHLPGFKEDERFLVIQALHKTLAVEDGAAQDKIYEYGFSQSALRGYEELCAEWNNYVTADEAFSEEKAKKLREEVLRDHQREHRDDVGAVRLFDELLKKENWCLWQTPTQAQEKERKAKNHSTNILRDYLRYQEVVERIIALEKKVNYTPADASLSRRLFDLKAGAQGGFGHGYDKERESLWFTTDIAIKNRSSEFEHQEVRIHYSAPRMIRDAARVLSEEEKLKEANWMPPMMRALGIEDSAKYDFSKHAVSLMPDWKPGSRSTVPERLLLNFVLTPKEDDFIGKLRKTMNREAWPWTRQFNVNGDFNEATLRWPHEGWDKAQKWKDFPKAEKGDKPVKWFEQERLRAFRFISVDLGQKQAGAYALMEANCDLSKEDKAKARYIGTTGSGTSQRDWYAQVLTTGLLKLPGENAEVFRPEYVNRKPVKATGDFREELSGAAGRKAAPIECVQTIALLEDLQQKELLDEDCRDFAVLQKRLMFPDQNAKLLVALRRAQSFAGRLHRWCWFLAPKEERKDQAQRRRNALKEIAETEAHPWLDADLHEKVKTIYASIKNNKDAVIPTLDPRVAGTLGERLQSLMKKLPQWLVIVANRVYRSRRGRFVWSDKHPDKEDCHLLSFEEWNEAERKGLKKEDLMLAGQRGLSITRIEQMEELRKRCQSLNQMARREVYGPPLKTRDDSIPDPCPTILAKLDNIKEQRRNQTAHLILTEALGLQLLKSNESSTALERDRAEAADLHGEYEKVDYKGRAVTQNDKDAWRGVVDFIVIEDLSRYRTTQGRSPRENSRLMKWCHRAVRDKLKEMCQPFGIPLIETPAAYSSRFCSRSGVAGFRATELSPPMLDESKWLWRVKRRDDGKEETEEQSARRILWEGIFENIRLLNKNRDGKTKGQEYRTLLVPDAGGSIFIPISGLNETYKRPPKNLSKPKVASPIVQYLPVNLEMSQSKLPRLIHADINAAVNLALRAVADPKVWSIHSRLRSERELGTQGAPKPSKRGKKKADSEEKTIVAAAEEIKPDRFFAKEKRKHGARAEAKAIEIKIDLEKSALPASESRHPNFFADFADLKGTHWGAAKMQSLGGDDTQPSHLVSGKALWGYVKAQTWKRIEAINCARMDAWKT